MRAILLLLAMPAMAQVDRAGNVMNDGGSGGSFGIGSLIAVILFFGGIFWLITRFEDETQGSMYLFGGVLAFIVIAGLLKCAG